MPSADQFNLSSIRDALARLEETIIFSAIERGQFTLNQQVYQQGQGVSLTPTSAEFPDDSFFEHFLYGTEKLHSALGRYRQGDLEHAFFAHRQLPKPALSSGPPETYGQLLFPNTINMNNDLLSVYLKKVVPMIALKAPHDDGHFGSTCVCDIALIQALSLRVHYGKLVAETKYRAETERFQALIKAKDEAGIMQALTNEAVEKQVIERVRVKAARYGRSEDEGGGSFKVDPSIIADMFRDVIMCVCFFWRGLGTLTNFF